MRSGEFREDLFYRIAAFPVTTPPLRDRRADIPLIAEYFLTCATERSGKSITLLSSEAMELLVGYDWPGNVRELENMIERAVLLETSGMLQPTSLPPEVHLSQSPPHILASQGKDITSTEIIPLKEVEKQVLTHALEVTGGDVREAAKALGIDRTTVYRKLKRHNLFPLPK